jgi:Ras GTPase-activating protein 1
VAKLREVRSLQLTISEAHRLPYKLVPNPYCIISLNQVKVARTKVKSGQDPVFDETFDLDDIPPDIMNFTVSVMNRGKRAKDAEVSEVIVDMSELKSGCESEEWYNLNGITPIGEWGSLR